jgi:hypothetical protein
MLIDADTTVAADGNLEGVVVDGSVLSHTMTAGADTSNYQASADSQEAIRNFVAPANEYDTELDVVLSSRAPASEYDTQLDANMTSRAPSGEYDTQLDVNMSTRATSAKQDTMETTLNAVPTTSEFEARTIVSANYVVVGDTIAGVTLVDTVTTNSDLVTAAAVKTAMEADNGDLDALMKGLINKRIWKEEDPDGGDLEMHNDAGGSIGTVEVQVDTDGSFTTAKRAFQAV